MSADFELDARLKNDSLHITDWPLCQVLLMNDEQYPWLILVPRVTGVSEIYELSSADQEQFLKESTSLGKWLMEEFGGFKLNVAALGNVVRQLHIHHVVRYESDAAWPGPIWGKHPVSAYSSDKLNQMLDRLIPLKSMQF